MAGKRKLTEEGALRLLSRKRDVVEFQELKQIMVMRTATNSYQHVGNGTLGVLDYLQNHCGYSVRYLNNNYYGKATIKEFKNSIREFRIGGNITTAAFYDWLTALINRKGEAIPLRKSRGRR